MQVWRLQAPSEPVTGAPRWARKAGSRRPARRSSTPDATGPFSSLARTRATRTRRPRVSCRVFGSPHRPQQLSVGDASGPDAEPGREQARTRPARAGGPTRAAHTPAGEIDDELPDLKPRARCQLNRPRQRLSLSRPSSSSSTKRLGEIIVGAGIRARTLSRCVDRRQDQDRHFAEPPDPSTDLGAATVRQREIEHKHVRRIARPRARARPTRFAPTSRHNRHCVTRSPARGQAAARRPPPTRVGLSRSSEGADSFPSVRRAPAPPLRHAATPKSTGLARRVERAHRLGKKLRSIAMPRAVTGSWPCSRRSRASITVRAANTSRRFGATAAVNPSSFARAAERSCQPMCHFRAAATPGDRPRAEHKCIRAPRPTPAASSRSKRAACQRTTSQGEPEPKTRPEPSRSLPIDRCPTGSLAATRGDPSPTCRILADRHLSPDADRAGVNVPLRTRRGYTETVKIPVRAPAAAMIDAWRAGKSGRRWECPCDRPT